MKLITLNIWGGIVNQPLHNFIGSHSNDIDIFAFQEVFNSEIEFVEPETGAVHHVLAQLKTVLPDHQLYYFPAQDGPGMDANYYPSTQYGLAFFVKKTIKVISTGDTFVHGYRNSYKHGDSFMNLPRNMAFIACESNGKAITIYNLHGLWTGGGKGDTQSRLEQSQKAKRFIDSHEGITVLCGDFNLLPDTESFSIIKEGLRDLIAENNITSTRTSLYKKEPRFADYILVSPDVEVNEFKILPDEVSDHSPLYLEFSV